MLTLMQECFPWALLFYPKIQTFVYNCCCYFQSYGTGSNFPSAPTEFDVTKKAHISLVNQIEGLGITRSSESEDIKGTLD